MRKCTKEWIGRVKYHNVKELEWKYFTIVWKEIIIYFNPVQDDVSLYFLYHNFFLLICLSLSFVFHFWKDIVWRIVIKINVIAKAWKDSKNHISKMVTSERNEPKLKPSIHLSMSLLKKKIFFVKMESRVSFLLFIIYVCFVDIWIRVWLSLVNFFLGK